MSGTTRLSAVSSQRGSRTVSRSILRTIRVVPEPDPKNPRCGCLAISPLCRREFSCKELQPYWESIEALHPSVLHIQGEDPCTGAVVDPQDFDVDPPANGRVFYLLTAAHCVSGVRACESFDPKAYVGRSIQTDVREQVGSCEDLRSQMLLQGNAVIRYVDFQRDLLLLEVPASGSRVPTVVTAKMGGPEQAFRGFTISYPTDPEPCTFLSGLLRRAASMLSFFRSDRDPDPRARVTVVDCHWAQRALCGRAAWRGTVQVGYLGEGSSGAPLFDGEGKLRGVLVDIDSDDRPVFAPL